MGQEMVTWLTQAQHIATKNIIVVGILDETKDDFGRTLFAPQIEGGKAGRELPGIFDQIIIYPKAYSLVRGPILTHRRHGIAQADLGSHQCITWPRGIITWAPPSFHRLRRFS